MKILEFSPVLLSPSLCDSELREPAFGGWVESLIRAMLKESGDVEFCVISLGNDCSEVTTGDVRYLTSDVKSFVGMARKAVKEFRPDVIHINGAEFFYAALPIDVYGNVPVVVSIQGLINGYMPHYNGALTPIELKGTNVNLRYLLRRTSIRGEQQKWYEERSKTEATAISQHKYFTGRTDWDRAWVQYINPTAKYFLVNETLRAPFYKAMRTQKTVVRHSIYCGAAAGYPLKGLHWLVRAIASLRDEFPDIQLRVAAANDRIGMSRGFAAQLKDDAYAIYLRRLIRQLGVQSNIVGLPSLSAEAVVKELEQAELFVLPSLCENSPNSLGEAMLVGTPAIATYVGGTPSILKDRDEGMLVPSADPAALACAIRHWFNHPDEAATCARKAQITAKMRHDGIANAKTMLAVYKEVINESV